jgi:hypothetical protein
LADGDAAGVALGLAGGAGAAGEEQAAKRIRSAVAPSRGENALDLPDEMSQRSSIFGQIGKYHDFPG